jgi:hypothetical protein
MRDFVVRSHQPGKLHRKCIWRKRVGIASFGATDNAQLTDFSGQQNQSNS